MAERGARSSSRSDVAIYSAAVREAARETLDVPTMLSALEIQPTEAAFDHPANEDGIFDIFGDFGGLGMYELYEHSRDATRIQW